MTSLFTYLFSLIFPDLNEFRSLSYLESDLLYDLDSESDLLYEFDIDTTDPQHFLTYG
jgi:hypothetical protein